MTAYSAKRIPLPTVATRVHAQPKPAKSAFVTLQGLKERTYRTWKSLHQVHVLTPFNLLTPTTDKDFKQAVRQFGDLRKKVTWENAWCALYAQLIAETPGDNVRLIRQTFTACAQAEGWSHLMPQVLDNFSEKDDAKECIQNGLERIFQEENEFPEELASFAQALAASPLFQQESMPMLALAAVA